MIALSFIYVVLFIIHPNFVDSAQGSIELFSNSNCTTLTPNGISGPWSVDQCIETYFPGSLSVTSFPTCENSGYPILTISDLVKCEPPSIDPVPSTDELGGCLLFASGNKIGSAKFKCVGGTSISSSKSTAPEPTTFTTSTTSRDQSEPTPTTLNAESDPIPTDSSQGGIIASSSLSISDKIALGTAIGIGVPALVFTILTWWNNWEIPEFLHFRHQPDPEPPPPYDMHVF